MVIDFVGRSSQIEKLWEWFLDPVSRRWALSGDGGKGKSALAYQSATEVQREGPEPIQIIIWISAKRRRFEEGSVIAIDNPDFSNLDSALSRILSEYGWGEDAEAPMATK